MKRAHWLFADRRCRGCKEIESRSRSNYVLVMKLRDSRLVENNEWISRRKSVLLRLQRVIIPNEAGSIYRR
jgi:hypothetical protein